MPAFESLPYRPCVGLAVFNRDGLVFIGRRINGPEHVDAVHVWQMPQGGIDAGEEPWPAAKRELYEETNIRSVEKLGGSKEWLCYDIPREIVGQAWNGKYRGQCQKWYALRFTGKDSEIDIAHPAGGHKPEFVEWRWEPLRQPPRPDRAVQAAGLRAGGEGIRAVREGVTVSCRTSAWQEPLDADSVPGLSFRGPSDSEGARNSMTHGPGVWIPGSRTVARARNDGARIAASFRVQRKSAPLRSPGTRALLQLGLQRLQLIDLVGKLVAPPIVGGLGDRLPRCP